MKPNETKKSGLSESYVVGVIALVFLIVGYQTALLVHRAAVTRIVSNRDTPDTVYVYKEPDAVKTPLGPVIQHSELVLSKHAVRAESVRKNVPRSRTESFQFDPNTISVEDLCRLGFTQKQAEAIDNYRKKGGIFHRKEDFSRSYVVADSVYRRLEPYIHIPPLDLNSADEAQLDNLPGIGEWYAKKIVEYRDELHGYSFKEQLLDIYKFDRQKYDGLRDLVTVQAPYVFPLWTLAADSLRKHPYIRNMETARSIVIFRENNPEEMWKVENLYEAGILSRTDADRLGRCVR